MLFSRRTAAGNCSEARRTTPAGFRDCGGDRAARRLICLINMNIIVENTAEGETGMKRRKVYLVMMALMLALLTVLLSAAALRTWQEGSARKAEKPMESVYTPENAEEQLRRISPLLLAVIGMAAAGMLLGIRDEKSGDPVPAPEAERDLIVSRLEEPGPEVRKERKRQRMLRRIRWLLFAACMVPVLIYCADGEHFPENDLEAMLASLALHTLPWAAMGLLALLAGALLEEKSIRREIGAARIQLRDKKGGGPAAAAAGKRPEGGTAAVRIALLLAAGVFIVLGALNGSLNDVLLKTINICTECIGLG